jgi:DNA topoisomerase-2
MAKLIHWYYMINNDKAIASKYQKLTDVEHCLKRPGRYIGSIVPKTASVWCFIGKTITNNPEKMIRKNLTWNPGFLKMFDEVITNSVDFSKTPEGKHLDTVKVEIDRTKGTISVSDNGGIPVIMHPEEKIYIPTLIFGFLRSGSNFDDDVESDGAGQNGEGASLTNIFSTEFTVETSDGKKKLIQTWTNNMQNMTEAKVSSSSTRGTKITYTPDYAHLKITLDDDNYQRLVKRVVDIAGCNPRLKVFLNGEQIKIKSFPDYIGLYTDGFVYDENPDWQVGIAKSDEGFEHVSFVNSTETMQGGEHVRYVCHLVNTEVREFIKKKYKVDVKPTEIQQHYRLFINARIIRPRYDSQTKENLMTEIKDFKTTWKPSEKFVKEVIKSDIIARIMVWVEMKARAMELEDLKGLNKESDKTNPKRILKLQDANLAGVEPNKCVLFITEGDSASKAGKSVGDRDTMGFLSLRGKPLNVSSALNQSMKSMTSKDGKKKKNKLADNEEFFNLMVAMGLSIGKKVKSVRELRYGKLAIMTDADHDGAHITGLLINNFHHFWPELFELGVIHRFTTPLLKVFQPGVKVPHQFNTEADFKVWHEKNPIPKLRLKYYKGLGTNQSPEFKEYLDNLPRHLVRIDITNQDDSDVIGLVFGKTHGSADRRKTWLGLSDADSIDFDVDETADELDD